MDNSEDSMLGLLSESARERVKAVTGRALGYIRQRYPYWDCSDSDLRSWLTWHWCHGLVALLEDAQAAEVAALVVARFFDDLRDYETDYKHIHGGQICYVQLAIANCAQAFSAAIHLLEARHGSPARIIFERGAKGLGPRIYLFNQFIHKLESQNVES